MTNMSPTELLWQAVVPGEPKPLQRARFSRGRVFDPSCADKRAFYAHVAHTMPPEPLEGPLRVDLVFRMKRPKMHFSAKRHPDGRQKLKPSAPTHVLKKVDCDNQIKFVLDALNEHLYGDDSQVQDIVARKCWASGDNACTEVWVYTATAPPPEPAAVRVLLPPVVPPVVPLTPKPSKPPKPPKPPKAVPGTEVHESPGSARVPAVP